MGDGDDNHDAHDAVQPPDVGPGGVVAADGADGPEGDDAAPWANLPPRQAQAVVALLNQPTLKQAGAACGVPERTLHRWLAEPVFARAYRAARRESYTHAVSLAQRYAAMAVNALATVMSDKAAPYPSKVAASVALLRFGRESIELDDLAARVEALEGNAEGARP